MRKQTIKARIAQLTRTIPVVYLCLKHPQTPWLAKLFAALTVAYALSPVDLIPDFIPIIGYLDDLLILPLLIAATIHFIPRDIWSYCQNQANQVRENGKANKWYYAIPVLLVWLLLLAWFLKRFIR